MSLDKSKLLGFLEELNENLERKITLVAVGGTALTLLGMKASTIDIDFTIPSQDFEEFERAERATPHGFHIDKWQDGVVFSTSLPEDYLKTSLVSDLNADMIDLRALHPLDIVVTKIGRLNERDKSDIEICIKKFKLQKDEIIKRAQKIELAGSEEAYDVNLQLVVNTYFKNNGD